MRSRCSSKPPERLEPVDAGLARETHLEALAARIFAGRLGGRQDLQELAVAARAAPAGPGPLQAGDLLLDGLAVRYTDGYTAGLAPLGERWTRSREGTAPATTACAGEFAEASVLTAESDAIVEATGNTRWPGTSLLLAAWRGQGEATMKDGRREHPGRHREGRGAGDLHG